MASGGPTVTLTFAGDTSNLNKSLTSVGESANGMSKQVGGASKEVQRSGSRLDGFSKRADDADTRAMGFRDAVTGVGDTMRGFTDDSLSTEERLLMLGMGFGDLASATVNLLIPAIKSLATFLRAGLGAALTFIAAHPVIAAITALAGLFVLLWTRSETFRNIVTSVFEAVWGVVSSVAGWIGARFQDLWGVLQGIASGIGSFFTGAFNGIRNVVSTVAGWIGDRFNDVKRIASSVGEAISGAFKSAFNFVADIWNNTVGSLSFSIPSWVPVVGGNELSMPKIPKFHTGGRVPGAPGTETLAMLQAGERVEPASRANRQARQGGGAAVTFNGNTDTAVANMIMQLMRSGKLQIQGA